MLEAFENLAREVVNSMMPIAPGPLVVANSRGIVVGASSHALIGET